MLIRITLLVHDTLLSKRLQEYLARPDILIQIPKSRENIWEWVMREPSDVLIISQNYLPKSLKEKMLDLQSDPDMPSSIVLSDSADPVEHARLIAQGCDSVLFAGLAVEQIRDVIETMLEKRRRQTQKQFFSSLPLAEPKLADFVSSSPGMATFMNTVPRVVNSDTALLIEGETGVGKERLASAIHAEGPRAKGRFVALNCGALPEHLIESELFGHVRGAFTGATTARRGWFEIAHHGTLFLDEVGEIPSHLQVKLLRVLQEHEVQPVGSEKSFGVDVRVIAASNRPLDAEAESGRFRRDLFHRLSVVTVVIPPLRDRIEDIPDLVNRQISYLSKLMRRHVTGIKEQAMQALSSYQWPGNVRELNNVIERAILLCDDTEITLDNLPYCFTEMESENSILGTIQSNKQTVSERAEPQSADHRVLKSEWLDKPLHEVRKTFLADFERQYLEALLIATKGRIGETAKRAGLQERSLYEKMKQYNLIKENFRKPAGSKGSARLKSDSERKL